MNHLGWIRSVLYGGQDFLPGFLQMLPRIGSIPGLPFDPQFLASLGMIPNEYLFYYYHANQAVENILRAGQTRGELIAALNRELFDKLVRLSAHGDQAGMLAAYQAYLEQRGQTYMANETGRAHDLAGLEPAMAEALSGEGYAGVALDLIEALNGARPRQMILNIPNQGAIQGMGDGDVVEISAYVAHDLIHPLTVGSIPGHCLGLMQQVKAYEQLAIRAAVDGSYALAVKALTLHPLVRDYSTARAILDGYIRRHGAIFPALR
ncbi:MAG TPA: hypothetical protein VF498_05185 [Anaerolineales bacterium]